MSDSPRPPSSSSKNSAVLWIVRNTRGQEEGPFTTEKILKLIRDGEVSGDEMIRRFPVGKWIPVSSQNEFYESLLQSLEEVVKPGSKPKARDEKTHEVSLHRDDKDEQSEVTQMPLPAETKTKILVPPVSTGFKPFEAAPPMGEGPVFAEPKQKKQNWRLPVFLLTITASLLMMFVLFWPDGDSTDGKPHLILPKPANARTLGPEKVREMVKTAVDFFVQDTFESYAKSQNTLVNLIEGDPQNGEARGLLCLVYRELWPYVRQDSQDLNSVLQLVRMTRSLDPIGINGIYCEVTRLFILGKYKEAKGVLDHSLNQPSLSAAPVLYFLKAEIIASEGDHKTAALYSEKARKLWPEWIKPIFKTAVYNAKSDRTSEALSGLQDTLKLSPAHKEAQIELALLNYKFFGKKEEALNMLTAALSTKGKISSQSEGRAHLVAALILAEKKQTGEALEHAVRAYELNPAESNAKDLILRLGGAGDIPRNKRQTADLVFIGDQYFRSGDCLAAQAEYKTAYELDSQNGLAAMKAAKCLWTLNQSADAIFWLNKAITADPNLVSAYVLLADYYSQRFNYPNAAQILVRASQKFSNNHEILRGFGMMELRRNSLKEAQAYLLRSFKIFENDVDTLVLLAQATAGLSDFKEALKYSVRAIEVDSTSADAQITYAKVLAQVNGVDAGISYLKSLVLKYSYTIEYRLGLAELYKDVSRSKQAQQIYQQILEADPRSKKALMGIGMTLQDQGLFDQSIKYYLGAALVDPTDAEPLYRTGLVYLERAKYKDAIVQFQRALKVNPLFPRLNYYIGRAHFENTDYNLALQAAQEERKINPGLADSYTLSAEVYVALKQFSKCAEEYQKALKLRPQGAELYVKLARCYRQSGNMDVAENMLNIAAHQESGMPDIYKEQGAVFESKGDAKLAAAAYNKYLALSPNAPDRLEIESRILKLSSGR